VLVYGDASMKSKLQLAFGILAIILVIISIVAMVVDGVAIILTYVSLLFALFSIAAKNRRILQLYGVLFVLAHVVLMWSIDSDASQVSTTSSAVPVDLAQFEACSNQMFATMKPGKTDLTPSQNEMFKRCMAL